MKFVYVERRLLNTSTYRTTSEYDISHNSTSIAQFGGDMPGDTMNSSKMAYIFNYLIICDFEYSHNFLQ